MPTSNLSGRRYGKLVAVKPTSKRKGTLVVWECKCDCGATAYVPSAYLTSGNTKSCGCYKSECSKARLKTHGDTKTRLWIEWVNMKQRCLNPKSSSYERYGAKGVSVCEEWKNSYTAFKSWTMSNGYADDLTIDRIDGTKGYSPENCRWVTKTQQANNRKTNKIVTYGDFTGTLSELCKKLSLSYPLVSERLRFGWSVEEAIELPPNSSVKKKQRLVTVFGRTMCLADWSRETGIHFNVLRERLQAGWDAERALTEKVKKKGTKADGN